MPRHSPRQVHQRAGLGRVLRFRWLVRNRHFQTHLAKLRTRQIEIYGTSDSPRPQRNPTKQRHLEKAFLAPAQRFEEKWKVSFALASWYLLQEASSPSGRVDEHAWAVDFGVRGRQRPERTVRQRPGKRLRLDSAEFQLAVWDAALTGCTFQEIARAADRPVSTVKSAWAAAHHRIYGTSAGSSKDAKRWGQEAFARHLADCPTCSGGKTSDQWCKKMLRGIR